MKMKMNELVDMVLEYKPVSIYRRYKDNEEKAIDILMLMFIQFQEFYNCKRMMNKEQLMELSYLVSENFRHLNYYDIAMCLKSVKTTEKLYDRIDGGMVMEWLSKYDVARTNLIINKREQQKSVHDGEWSALSDRSSVQKLKDYLR